MSPLAWTTVVAVAAAALAFGWWVRGVVDSVREWQRERGIWSKLLLVGSIDPSRMMKLVQKMHDSHHGIVENPPAWVGKKKPPVDEEAGV